MHLSSYQENVLDIDFNFFKELTSFSSQTNDFPAIRLIQNWLKEKFEKNGARVVKHFNHEDIPLLEISWGNEKLEPIILVCHADTVQKVSEKCQFDIDHQKNIVRGPGILDNKAGVFIAHETLRFLRNEGKEKSVYVKVIISPSEERGSTGFHSFYENLGKKSRFIFGLEPGEQDGSIIKCRGGNRWYEFVFKGAGYHSGRIQKEQISLGNEIISRLNSAFQKINHQGGAKLNLTHIESDNPVFNTTCEQIKIRLDLRFLNNQTRDCIHQNLIEDLFKGLDFSFKIHDDCPAMAESNSSENLINMYNQFLPSAKRSSVSYGAADVNYFSNKDNHILDGLGGVGGNMHRKDEYVELNSLKIRSLALKEMIKELFLS